MPTPAPKGLRAASFVQSYGKASGINAGFQSRFWHIWTVELRVSYFSPHSCLLTVKLGTWSPPDMRDSPFLTSGGSVASFCGLGTQNCLCCKEKQPCQWQSFMEEEGLITEVGSSQVALDWTTASVGRYLCSWAILGKWDGRFHLQQRGLMLYTRSSLCPMGWSNAGGLEKNHRARLCIIRQTHYCFYDPLLLDTARTVHL